MEKKKSYKKYFYGIFVPIMVMVVALSAAGISYAWFSDSVTSEISTIHLSTAEIFTLEFVISGDANNYEGQKAVLGSEMVNNQFPIGEDGGHLVTSEYAINKLKLEKDSSLYNIYMQDEAYGPYIDEKNVGARLPLRLDTDGKTVELKISLSSVTVKKENADSLTIQIPSSDTKGYVASDIAYGFTWYLEHGETTYTPYGTNSSLSSKTLSSGFDSTETISLSATSANLGTNETNAYFTIVFAPEKLYWAQYSNSDWDKTVSEVYSDDWTNTSFKNKWTDINKYSAIAYAGATFTFEIQIEVVSISES